MPIEGQAKRLYRKDITQRIAEALGVPPPDVPPGSTVGTDFLDDVVAALGGDSATLASTYRKIEFALDAAGEVYDPGRDSSEYLGRVGGGTVTNGGYRKLLRGVTRAPQCFILNVADNPISEQYRDVPGESYGFNENVSGRVALLEAGAGSRVVFYRTKNAAEEPKQAFSAHAVISDVGAAGDGTYRAALTDYEEFESPVRFADVSIADWNSQHGIAEIDYPTLAAIVQAGTGAEVPTDGTGADATASGSLIDAPIPKEVTDEGAAGRLLRNVGPVDATVDLPSAAPLPELPEGSIEPSPEEPTKLSGENEGPGALRRMRRIHGPARRKLNRYIEARAVHIAREYLADQGWNLHRDCQALGIGYDLEYRKDGEVLHVEVKGIQGDSLTFNLTALEWARVVDDSRFVVVAVTGVLFQDTMKIHVITRDRLAAANRRAVQYRVVVE